MDRLVRQARLAALLGVDLSTLYRWRVNGLLEAIMVRGEWHFYEHTINCMLAETPHTTPRAITYDDLYSGRVTLVRKYAPADELGMTHAEIDTATLRGHLCGIQLGRYWYVTRGSVNHYREVAQFDLDTVGRIIGVHARAVLVRLLANGQLEHHAFSGQHHTFVTQASLVAYLRAHNPSWVIPEIWLEEHLDDKRDLLELEEIAAILNRRPLGLPEFLDKERLAYVWLPGQRIRRYSPMAFDTHMALEQRPSRTTVGRWFNVPAAEIDRWRALSLLHCPLPHHDHPLLVPFYESCWVAMITPWLSPGMQANTWLQQRKSGCTFVRGRKWAAARLHLTVEEVQAFAEEGMLKGLRTPVGQWRFTENAVTQFGRSLRRMRG